jgi:hypothetical protein
MDARALAIAELEVPGDEIRMEVGEEDVPAAVATAAGAIISLAPATLTARAARLTTGQNTSPSRIMTSPHATPRAHGWNRLMLGEGRRQPSAIAQAWLAPVLTSYPRPLPEVGTSWAITRRLGYQGAFAYYTSGEHLDAERA